MRYALLQRTRHHFSGDFLTTGFCLLDLIPTIVSFLLDPGESDENY